MSWKYLYKFWCFFMDSKKEFKQYWDECDNYQKKHPCNLITFAPYPGRLKWREWWILKKYKSLMWKFYYKKIHPEISLNIKQIKFECQKRELKNNWKYLPMVLPVSDILFIQHKREKIDD